MSLVETLDAAVAAAKHLAPEHGAAVEAARLLAAKIDAWDVIVQWAIEDAAAEDGRPKVPAHDNTSLSAFLKYMETLQLVPEPPAKAKPGPAPSASPEQQALNDMRKGLHAVS